MQAADPRFSTPWRARVRLRHALAGLEAGVLGSLLMSAWLVLCSLSLRRPPWSVPDLFATVFNRPDAVGNSFVRSSLAGLAVIVVLYGALGILWGVSLQENKPRFLRLIGALTGLAVYALFFKVIWPHARPLVALYAPDRQLQVGHMLWGIMLASSPRFARGIASANGAARPASETVPEIKSGDVIL